MVGDPTTEGRGVVQRPSNRHFQNGKRCALEVTAVAMSESARRVVIAGGSGPLGTALAAALRSANWQVRVVATPASLSNAADDDTWACDLTSIADAEVALAGAHTVVFLARTRERVARLVQGARSDLDALLADSVSRAAARVGAQHLVFFACAENDPNEALLRETGVPFSVLRGGGQQPVTALAELVQQGRAETRNLPEWKPTAPRPVRPPSAARAWSVQRFERPAGATALALAEAYFQWLPSVAPLTRVERFERTFTISAFGSAMLVLRHSPGRSERDCAVFDVVGGSLTANTPRRGRVEFRLLRDGSAVTALIDFAPGLPWVLYRVTQALVHARVMRLFAQALANKSLVPNGAPEPR